MKTMNLKHTFAALLCMAACAGLAACDSDTIETEGGKLPDREPIENVYGMLRSNASAGNTVNVLLTQGEGFDMKDFYFQQTKPASEAFSLAARADASLADAYNEDEETERTLLPAQNYEFPDGTALDLSKDSQRSLLKRIKFLASGLNPGQYVLPLTVAEEGAPDRSKTLYYNITVRQPQVGDTELYQGDDLFFVFYINTSEYQPLLVDDYYLSFGTDPVHWNQTIGNIINLRTVRLGCEESTGRALLDLGSDMRYVLGHATKYIRPLQDKGRKVCISIEGGGSGLGFCNLDDAQIADFTAQVKAVVAEYELDGINLWDRNAGYGKEGMPAMNTTSYPKLIKALREALGTDKLLTVAVYDRPTETFHDVEACGGIAVGDYIDYAWSGYNDPNELENLLLDPYHPDLDFVSTHTQGPIANLPKEHFGCINCPTRFDPAVDPEYMLEWVEGGYKSNNIIVFADLQTNLQDTYETVWPLKFATWCDLMDENSWLYTWVDADMYVFNMSQALDQYPEKGGYGKWLKDWK